ncbi:MAG: cation transporter [Pseudomonadales bacterium]|nr:cation transporter [Pseudomonadales bacterium]MCP5185900.1 cation transporter [Pseudomonadales bacterium]
MSHDHDHDHHHDHTRHDHVPAGASERMLRQAFVLIASFMAVEFVGGWLANSLTLLADAGHMFLDATALGLAWYAARLAQREDNNRLSYGYHRFKVLAAFVNGLTLAALVVWILIEAATRLGQPEPMAAIPTLVIAALGLAVNVAAYRLLHAGQHDMNVRAAAIHVLGDLLGSAAAIMAALIVYTTGWLYADPLLALAIALLLGRGAWRVIADSAHILLEGVPEGMNLHEIRHALLESVPGLREVHHVHAWSLTSERPLVTLHAHVETDVDVSSTTSCIKQVLLDRFGIDHSTIQVEQGPCPDR